MTGIKFTYRSGQRPLDGFTLKRGVGQGGFGEVYFAVSDGGKEVALKLLRGHTDAELRGISHCLNLKHPNLVHLYDVRTDDRGERWVVMEYVFGESLAQVINKHPKGLPSELIREWMAALSRGVSYLHDRGVVHRDLKPANIFIEHGLLKIGDYGLSRRMSASERGELTRGVGTPHYMAPEVKNGNYGRSIDVYASGIILFEMITGHPPFEGETPAEVLMKHQLDTPDLTKVPANIRPVLQRVLEKDPTKRFATMMEFAKAVEAVLGGERREATATAGVLPPPKPVSPDPKVPLADTVVDEKPSLATPGKAAPKKRAGPGVTMREKLVELAAGFSLAPVVALACTVPCLFIDPSITWSVLARIFLLSTLLTWALLLVGRLPRHNLDNTWGRRSIQLVVGVGIGALAFWLDGWSIPRGTASASSHDLVLSTGHRISPETLLVMLRYLFYFGLTTAACRWWTASDFKRRKRVRIVPVLAAALWAAAFLLLWPWGESSPMMVGFAPLVIAAIAVQAASPWAGPPLPVAYAIRPRHRPAYI